jgi:alpha-amylase/alpha-mannosidase (GH57 family)
MPSKILGDTHPLVSARFEEALMLNHLLLALLALALAVGCNNNGNGPGDPDGGDPGRVADLDVEGAFSRDGTSVIVTFEDPIRSAGTNANYAVVASDLSTATVGTPAAVGNVVTLPITGGALDTGKTWEVTVTGITRESDGGTLTTDPTTVPVTTTVFLNLVWHQHQPSYLDPVEDQLQGPWVRKHATKDYFDMTAELLNHANVHFNVNLTSSLLSQLHMYVDRLGPYVNTTANTVDESGFLAAWADKTDPWVDLLLEDTPEPGSATAEQLGRFYADVWSCRSIAEPLLAFFPDYEALVESLSATPAPTQLDLMYLKIYFEIGWMDPDFLNGSVTLYDNVVIDLSDVMNKDGDGFYTLDAYYTSGAANDAERLSRGEELANRLVAENYKIAKGVVELHKQLIAAGSLDVLTTPFFHPILPLLHDTDLAAEGQPSDPLPSPAFSWPNDAHRQVAMAVDFYARTFGAAPRGMWPSEGAVAEEIIDTFESNGIEWIATDVGVLEKGLGDGTDHLKPYKIDVDTVAGDGGDTDDELMIVFRDTELSDKVGFHYQGGTGEENAEDFIQEILDKAPRYGEAARLLTVILDGENAWEWYALDHDAKEFLDLAYQGLTAAYATGEIITVTGSEYIDGNAARGVPAHPVSSMTEYEDLFPASWIFGSLNTWIGEAEENLAWTYLSRARNDFESAGAPTLANLLDAPSDATELAWWNATRSLFAAEGSDWFWWYGTDQTAAGGDDTPFDNIFRAQLTAMYRFVNEALTLAGEPTIDVPAFPPVIQPAPVALTDPFSLTLPTLDGVLDPDDSEWVPPAGIRWDNDSGVDLDPDDDIRRIFFGYEEITAPSADQIIYLALEFNEDLEAKLSSNYRVAIYANHQHVATTGTDDPVNTTTEEGVAVSFRADGAARQILLDFSGSAIAASLNRADGSGGWDAMTDSITVAPIATTGTLIELAVPMSDLEMGPGDPLEILVVAAEGTTPVDILPNINSHVIFVNTADLVTVIFEVDVTGTQIPIDEYITIANPPPPAGTGVASIVGNQDLLGNWTPNSVFMADDGVAPDAAAGDSIFTISFTFPPMTELQYKYTIGDPGDGWGGTEEYPLTNRGYDVPGDGTRRVRIRDLFADRPDPSGSVADLTTVAIEE